jgi:hypothetical protein
VKDVSVVCATHTFVLGGTVKGLQGDGLVLAVNGGDALTLNAANNGSFSFPTPIKDGATYDVKVKTQPTGAAEESCAVSARAGTVANGPVTSLVVTCIVGKRVFVTSARYNANLGGLAGADAKCQARADAADLGGTYKAWLSDATGSPSTRFTKSTSAYVRVDGTTVANDWADLTDGTLVAGISITELDTQGAVGSVCDPNDVGVWTNTATDGTQLFTDASCANWTGTAGGSVSWGLGGNTGEGFTYACSANGTQVCPSVAPIFTAALYCFQQ